ncbi:Carkd [Symbiodinium natans]|uniref:Carkd protein n=1 Tax=Symbiodinium natans TaxID=878477 RepID=A0A812JHG9_9DINO|nr:Carkd [Symbiodinium natans]
MEVFWRLPLTSSSQFRKEDRHLAFGLVPVANVSGARPISQIAGWIACELVQEAAPGAGRGLRCESGALGPGCCDTGAVGDTRKEALDEAKLSEEPAVFEGPAGTEVRWTGLLSMEPGSKLRLVGPSNFRLTFGRSRQALPKAVLRSSACPPAGGAACGEVRDWFEVLCRPGKASVTATVEILSPPQGHVNAAWGALCWSRFERPEIWPLIRVLGDWVDGGAGSCPAPTSLRVPPTHLRNRDPDAAGTLLEPPRLALLVVLAVQPAESGVGCMTPNWSLVAALDEALYRNVGPQYELHVAQIAAEEELDCLATEDVLQSLSKAPQKGVVYFLSPQQVKGAFRTKSYLIHDEALFALMDRLERAGLPTVWPHPLHLFKALAGKVWPPQVCLSPQYHVPLTTCVPRGAVLADSQLAAEEALQALKVLREASARPPEVSGTVVKVGFSWKSEGVTLCQDRGDLKCALEHAAEAGSHSYFMVQERIEDLCCEAMVYVLGGEIVGHPQYYSFPYHKAPPQYMLRKTAAQMLGGESVQRDCEVQMKQIAQRWIVWIHAQCSTPVPFFRVDFLLALPRDARDVQIWTGEVSELGVAVSFQEIDDHQSCDMVMDAVLRSVLSPNSAGAVHRESAHGCEYRVNLEAAIAVQEIWQVDAPRRAQQRKRGSTDSGMQQQETHKTHREKGSHAAKRAGNRLSLLGHWGGGGVGRNFGDLNVWGLVLRLRHIRQRYKNQKTVGTVDWGFHLLGPAVSEEH